jgi:hypothetical protein
LQANRTLFTASEIGSATIGVVWTIVLLLSTMLSRTAVVMS